MSASVLIDADAHEGPVYAADEDALYFTTQRQGERVDIVRLDLSRRTLRTVRRDANAANGMALAPDGGLLVCEQGTRSRPAAITRMDRSGAGRRVVVDAFHGEPLNSPNDVVVHSDGSVWFTDPSYGHLQGFRPPPRLGEHVYRHDPGTAETVVVASSFGRPNGLAFSPDESVLYVGDSERNHVKAFDVAGGGLSGERLFAVIDGSPDGLKTDAAGRVYTTGCAGVVVFDADGTERAGLPIPGAVNFCFAGDGVLLVTADDAIWSATID